MLPPVEDSACSDQSFSLPIFFILIYTLEYKYNYAHGRPSL